MAFRMFPVLRHSTRHLSDEDISAMTQHLVGNVEMQGPRTLQPVASLDTPVAAEGHRLYLGACAGCHGSYGEGQPHSSVPLRTNTMLMFENPLNLVRIIAEGMEERDLARGERMQRMPGFASTMSAAQIAALSTYLRQRWGGQAQEVTAEDVGSILAGE